MEQLENSTPLSPFNNMRKYADDSTGKYSFIVSGHFHGSSNNLSGFPAASLLANLERINNMGVVFVASTGDLFLDIEKDIPNYEMALFNKLTAPLFNAVGNHDVSGKIYDKNFGDSFARFTLRSELFIFLDTERDNGSIKNEQLEFLKHISSAEKNVFIFSHRPIWAEEDEEMKDFFLDNTRSEFGNNFKNEVEPLLIEAAKTKNIYWFSGSLGNAPASFFYHKDEHGITYIQSAIRDLPRDAMLKVNVDNGKVSFETFSLNSNKVEPLEYYNIDYWKEHYKDKPPFNFRLVPLYVKNTVTHRYYWYGIASCMFGVLVVWLIMRRRKKKK